MAAPGFFNEVLARDAVASFQPGSALDQAARQAAELLRHQFTAQRYPDSRARRRRPAARRL
jgi:tripartite-type tricarboxylate transporter receptor subunit TctC